MLEVSFLWFCLSCRLVFCFLCRQRICVLLQRVWPYSLDRLPFHIRCRLRFCSICWPRFRYLHRQRFCSHRIVGLCSLCRLRFYSFCRLRFCSICWLSFSSLCKLKFSLLSTQTHIGIPCVWDRKVYACTWYSILHLQKIEIIVLQTVPF